MGLGGFSSGLSKGYIDESDNQNDRAFKLKLQSAQIEGQMNAKMQEDKANYELTSRLSPGVTRAAGDYTSFDFSGAATKDQPVMDALIKSKSDRDKQAALAKRGASTGMTVAEFEDARGVKTGMKSDQWMNPSQIKVWSDRLTSEKPTPEVMNSYKAQMAGGKLLDQLERMRKDALTEAFSASGPLQGRAFNLAVAADNGKYYPKSKAYLDFAKTQMANIAHLDGEIGRLAEGDIDRAKPMAPDFGVADAAAAQILGAARENVGNNMKTAEELFPQLRRMRETEQAGAGLQSKVKAAIDSQAQTPEAVRARFRAHMAKKLAAEQEKKGKK